MDAAIWCRHLVPDRSRYGFLADHRHQLFPPKTFADLTRQGRGHPSVPAEVVASVLVLQALEGLSDREAASSLRRDIAWKIACGLGWTTMGSIPRCWCTGATASAPRSGPSGSLMRSARWWRRPGCLPGSGGELCAYRRSTMEVRYTTPLLVSAIAAPSSDWLCIRRSRSTDAAYELEKVMIVAGSVGDG
jgi:hypothetical protein